MTRTQRQIAEHRQSEACVQVHDPAGRPCPGVAVWLEQETHAFVFGCVAPDLGALPEVDRQRCQARLAELCNRLVLAGELGEPGATRVDVPDGVHLGRFRRELDRLSSAGLPLKVHVRGRAVGLDREEGEVAQRMAELYTLCFAHPAVVAIVWNGFWDGEEGTAGAGLLRLDFAPRPAFRYLHKLIDSVWHTRASGQTGPDGRFRFRGFFGDYRVAARVGEEAATTAVFPFRRGASPFGLRIALLPLPPEYDRQVWSEVTRFEKESEMPYITFAERHGMEQGMKNGQQIGLLKAIRLGVELKFAQDAAGFMPEVEKQEDLAVLEAIYDAIRPAGSIDDLRKLLPAGGETKQG